MKAKRWVMRDKRDVVLEEYELRDVKLKPLEIGIEVDYTAVSPGTECANYLALDPDVYDPDSWCAYPWQAGYSGTGRVTAIGSKVKGFEVGDRVVGAIPHGTHWRMNSEGQVALANPEVAPEYSAYTLIIAICTTALQVLRNDQLDPFKTAGIWGQGTIGNITAQILQAAGYRVVGIDPVEQRRNLSQACGIGAVLDPTRPDFAAQAEEMTHGHGLDVAVDTTGQAAVTVDIPKHIRMRGEMVLMTHWRSQPQVDASPFIHQVFWNGLTVHGAHMRAPGHEPWSYWEALQRRKFVKIQQELASGRINVAPLISHRVRPEQCREVYEGLCFDQAHWWGAVVDWQPKKRMR